MPLFSTKPPVFFACTLRYWTRLLLVWLLGLSVAAEAATPPLPGTRRPLAEVLNTDGTLRIGAKGSFDPAGYQLSADLTNGALVFRPSGTGDEKWQDGFGLTGTNGPVLALAVDAGGNVYAGGNFTVAGQALAKNIAKWDGRTWSALGSGTNAPVNTLLVDGSGLYVGGDFSTAGGMASTSYLARWTGTAWTSVGGGMNDQINAMALDGQGGLYVGGSFTQAGTVAAFHIAHWNGRSWYTLDAGIQGTVYALAVDGTGNLYAGGTFMQAGTVANTGGIARWDGSAWNALGNGMGLAGTVRTLAVVGSNVYVGGQFNQVSGVAASNVARWSGSGWSTLGAGANSYVYALAADGSGGVYVSGGFTQLGGASANGLGRWNGSAWTALGTGLTSFSTSTTLTAGRALVVKNGGHLFAGGEFTTAGSRTASYLAEWDGSTWQAVGSGTGPDAELYTLAIDAAGTVYAGGIFATAGGVVVQGLAKWNGRVWAPLGPAPNGPVYALTVDGSGNVYAGGLFSQIGGVAARSVARWNGSTWIALGAGINGTVNALAVAPNGVLYAGGGFVNLVDNIAQWNGSTWSTLGAGINGRVEALVVDANGQLYAGGQFFLAGGVTSANIVNNVARWDGSNWHALGTGVNDRVFALTCDASGALYVGGIFSSAGNVLNTRGLAKWNGSTWSSVGGSVSSQGGSVGALAFDAAGNLYAGGRFLDMGGVFNTRNVAKWNGSAWNTLGTGLNDYVNALVTGPAQEVYVGGNFTAVSDGSKVTAHFGVYDPRLLTGGQAAQANPAQLVYPNPTAGALTVRRPAGPATTATLYNSLGQAVRLLALPTVETTVNLRGLPTGVYILRLTLNGQAISKRVVVE